MTHLDTPERRYVRLHRAIEQGRSSDAVWAELSQVCLLLGYKDEAIRGVTNVVDPKARHAAELYLVQKGALESPSDVYTAREETGRPSIREEVTDSIGYLFLEHMPMTVMAATLTFPLVLGLGGFLTAGTELWVFPAIALLPVLAAVGVVGALARQILLEATRGAEEPTGFPEFTRLVRSASRFLVDSAIVLVALLGPGLLASQLGIAWSTSGSLLALGGALAPIVLALRQTRNDWRAFSAPVVLPTIHRLGISYLWMILVTGLLALPAIAAIALTTGSDLYLRLSFVGPLAIAPLFIGSRVMGRIIYLHRKKLGDLIIDRSGRIDLELAYIDKDNIETYKPQSTPRRSPVATKRHRRRAPLNAPRHPENQDRPARAPSSVQRRVRDEVAQAASRTRSDHAARVQAEAEMLARAETRRRKHLAEQEARRKQHPNEPAPARQPQKSAPRQDGRRPAPAAPGQSAHPAGPNATRPQPERPRPARPQPERPRPARPQPEPATTRQVETVASLFSGEEIPDLVNLPGARVLRGRDRDKAGASATPHRDEDFFSDSPR